MADTMHSPSPDEALRSSLRRQYGAGLSMLRSAVASCPDEAWRRAGDAIDVAQLAYHTLFFTHLYLMTDESAFVPWPGHDGDAQNPDGLPGRASPHDDRPLLPPAYAREEVLTYLAWIEQRMDGWLAALDLDAPTSGFPWYPIGKLDHQLVNLRHLQHHVGQIVMRVRDAGADPGRWIAADPMPRVGPGADR